MIQKYEGRSINKLQNSIILLVFQISKIRNIRFVGNCTLNMWKNFFDDDVIIVTNTFYMCIIFLTTNPS